MQWFFLFLHLFGRVVAVYVASFQYDVVLSRWCTRMFQVNCACDGRHGSVEKHVALRVVYLSGQKSCLPCCFDRRAIVLDVILSIIVQGEYICKFDACFCSLTDEPSHLCLFIKIA